MTSITVSKELHSLFEQIRKHSKDVSTITTMKFLLIGGAVKRIQDEKLIPRDVSEAEYFVENTGLPYSTLNHARNCRDVYSDVIIVGSNLEDIGPAKLIRFLPLMRDKTKEQKEELLHQIKPLSGTDSRTLYLEMKGEPIEQSCLCEEFEKVEKEVCKACGREKGKAKSKEAGKRTR
jgi:hypothetical protein